MENTSVISDLSNEIRKTLRYYMKSKSNTSYNRFLISGGASKLLGLIDFLTSDLNIELEQFDCVQNLKFSNKVKDTANYSIAIGLALRGTLKDVKEKSRSSNNILFQI